MIALAFSESVSVPSCIGNWEASFLFDSLFGFVSWLCFLVLSSISASFVIWFVLGSFLLSMAASPCSFCSWEIFELPLGSSWLSPFSRASLSSECPSLSSSLIASGMPFEEAAERDLFWDFDAEVFSLVSLANLMLSCLKVKSEITFRLPVWIYETGKELVLPNQEC